MKNINLKIEKFFTERGFGFASDENGTSYFFHIKNVKGYMRSKIETVAVGNWLYVDKNDIIKDIKGFTISDAWYRTEEEHQSTLAYEKRKAEEEKKEAEIKEKNKKLIPTIARYSKLCEREGWKKIKDGDNDKFFVKYKNEFFYEIQANNVFRKEQYADTISISAYYGKIDLLKKEKNKWHSKSVSLDYEKTEKEKGIQRIATIYHKYSNTPKIGRIYYDSYGDAQYDVTYDLEREEVTGYRERQIELEYFYFEEKKYYIKERELFNGQVIGWKITENKSDILDVFELDGRFISYPKWESTQNFFKNLDKRKEEQARKEIELKEKLVQEEKERERKEQENQKQAQENQKQNEEQSAIREEMQGIYDNLCELVLNDSEYQKYYTIVEMHRTYGILSQNDIDHAKELQYQILLSYWARKKTQNPNNHNKKR